MNKLVRYYNQNRKQIWLIIIIIVFILGIIQFFNSYYEKLQQEDDENNLQSEVLSENVEEKNEPMVQGSIGSNEKKEEFTILIEQFLDYCCNNKPEEAYKLLSNDCKEKLYPTEKVFETGYYNTKFSGNKTYDFQLWSAVDKTYIYLVKIYDNMLYSGTITSQHIQDYYSVIQEDGNYRLSISSYIKNVNYQFEQDNADDGSDYIKSQADNIKITAYDKDCYMDYEIYNILVINDSEQRILLDTLLEDDTIVVLDENGNEFEAMIIEFNEEDLIIEKGASKFIKIKFARSYVSGIETENIKFKNIVKNYEEYIQNKKGYTDFAQIKIDLK